MSTISMLIPSVLKDVTALLGATFDFLLAARINLALQQILLVILDCQFWRAWFIRAASVLGAILILNRYSPFRRGLDLDLMPLHSINNDASYQYENDTGH